jgi:tRNA(fMet)-specific endonuclease VapC
MNVLLDTNICIAFLSGLDRGVRDRILSLSPGEVVLCSVVKAELLYGARNSERVEENLSRLARFFAPLRSLPFDDEAAARYGLLRAQLRREGRPIGANDMMIAAIALASDLTLVTRNEREYAAIAGLRVTTW